MEGEGINEIGVDQNRTIRVKINPKYYRPCEVDLLLGNAKKLRKNWDGKESLIRWIS